MISNCGVREDSWESLGPGTARRSKQSILKEINSLRNHSWMFIGNPLNVHWNPLNIHWKDWRWSWSSNTLAIYVKSQLIGRNPDAGKDWRQEEKRGDREWDGWMASPSQWTWAWANSRRWWRTGKPGVLQSMGLQRVGHDLVNEQQQQRKTQ